MQKVINIFYTEDIEELGGQSGTGLVLELEDGTFLRGQSTDVLKPFEPFEPKK